jgi:MFS family permease
MGGTSRWLILAMATWTQASATLVTYGVGPLSAIWKKEWHLSDAEAGLLVSAVQIGPLLSMLWIGHAMDRYGERWLISLGSVLLGLSFLLVLFTNHYILLLLALGLVGIWYGTAQPGGSKVILKWFSEKERGLAMGIRQSGIPIGGAIGGALIPLLSVRWGWESAVAVQAALAISGGLLFLLMYRDPNRAMERDQREQPAFMERLKRIMANRQVWPVLGAGMVLVSLQMVIVGHLMLFFTHETKLGIVTAGQLLSTALIAGVAGRIFLGRFSDRWRGNNRIYPLHLSVWASLAGIGAVLLVNEDWPLWSLTLLSAWLGFFGIGWFSSFLLAVAEHAPAGSEGMMVSYALTLNQVAIIAAPALFGLVVDAGSHKVAWGMLALLIFGTGVWLIVHRRIFDVADSCSDKKAM